MADCSSGANGDCRNRHVATKLKGVAITIILFGSTMGVLLPILGRNVRQLRADGDLFFITKSFAAGVILATAFIHILPDAFDLLGNPCLDPHPWTDLPFAGFISMCGALFTLLMDFLGTQYYERKHTAKLSMDTEAGGGSPEAAQVVAIHAHGHGHGISSAVVPVDSMSEEKLANIRHVVISQVLEMGIVAHSIIIGLALGTSDSPCTIRPLMAALFFHQFFEGLALGGCITLAGFKSRVAAVMAFFFAITTPLGIGIGWAIQSSYNENSPKSLILEGVLQGVAAGILVYMALVDLIAADFLGKRLRSNTSLQLYSFGALFLGAGAMTLIGHWA